ncbi:MAG: universal stress protein [Betaproteobacteria bacterium]
MSPYKHILVPTDGSKLSLKAAHDAIALAGELDATITTLFVIQPWLPPVIEGALAYNFERAYDDGSKAQADAALGTVAAAAAAANVTCEKVAIVDGEPWDGIIKTARKHKCDLIVMASHGRRGIAGMLLGSETQKVLTHSNIPVLVCR